MLDSQGTTAGRHGRGRTCAVVIAVCPNTSALTFPDSRSPFLYPPLLSQHAAYYINVKSNHVVQSCGLRQEQAELEVFHV